MDEIEFPPDFIEFLRSLNANGVDYLLVGGFAVAIHGYPRATADMDVWVGTAKENAERIVAALRQFGFDVPGLDPDLFVVPDQIIRMGVAPIRIEILTSIDGVEFADCARRSVIHRIGEDHVPVIGLDDLKTNKAASGRNKDLDDLDNLP